MQEVQKSKSRGVRLPIGRAAKLVFEMDALRAECSDAAQLILSHNPVDGHEFEECAQLDDALAQAHNLLKAHLRKIMISRISRRSRDVKDEK